MSAPDTKPPATPATPPAPEAGREGFLARWSRRKRAAEAGQALPEPAQPTPMAVQQTTPTELPDPATLSFDDDFTRYLGAQVPAALKRAAMAKLFADPCFNQMDGLDVYIEDYNLVPDLPAGERELLAHVREVLGTAPTPDREAPPSAPLATAETEPPAPAASQPVAPDQPADPGALQPSPKA